MNAEVKKRWVEALCSGEFEQGFKYLRTGEKDFCCLGVLCELHRREHQEYDWKQYADGRWFYGEAIYSPHSNVSQWAGITSAEEDNLATMNDNGNNFIDIACHIEEKL